MPVVRFFDLFCGAGGSSLGAQQAGAIPVGGLDFSDVACRAYQLNIKGATVICCDIRSFDPRDINKKFGPIQLLLASPECVAHSIARGNRSPSEQSRALAFEVVRFAETLRPRWLVVENVPMMRCWPAFVRWLQELERLGYQLTVQVLNSFDFGVPQTRSRLFIIGDLLTPPQLPRFCRRRSAVASSIIGTGLSDLEKESFSPLNKPGRAERTLERAQSAIKELGPDNEFILVYYGSDRAGGFQTLDRPLRTVTTLDRFALVRPNCQGYEMRMLQPSELAAAMGFPRRYRWPEGITRREKIRLLGNAVCPPVMRAIVRSLLRNT